MSYTIALFVFCFIIPCRIIVTSYILILITVKESRKAVEQHVLGHSGMSSVLAITAKVTAVVRSAFLQLRLINQLRPYLEFDCLATVTHALVTSRLDFCNALYVGLPLKTVRTLQLVQNRAARLLTGTGRYAHMTPVFRQLHWLPIEARAQFKVLIMTYKALNGLGPGYLNECLRPYMPDRPLRSAGESLLREPSMKEIRRLSISLCIGFFAAWSPYAIIAMWSTFGSVERIPPLAFAVPAVFAKSSTLYNPIISALIGQFLRSTGKLLEDDMSPTETRYRLWKDVLFLVKNVMIPSNALRTIQGTITKKQKIEENGQCKGIEQNYKPGKTRNLFQKIQEIKWKYIS
ncbi:Visual pigment-like receptor peropsin [Varanus komodoensis]|nr:Visual pigment-like receptor peropsin [Varanus komodoensis]